MPVESALLLWTTAALAGSMLFFGIVVAPSVFRVLPPDQAGVFLRAFFPRYYLWGLVVTVLATLAAFWSDKWIGLLCAVIALLFLFARQWLMPQINAARDAEVRTDADHSPRFKRLHRLSVNSACRTAATPSPSSAPASPD